MHTPPSGPLPFDKKQNARDDVSVDVHGRDLCRLGKMAEIALVSLKCVELAFQYYISGFWRVLGCLGPCLGSCLGLARAAAAAALVTTLAGHCLAGDVLSCLKSTKAVSPVMAADLQTRTLLVETNLIGLNSYSYQNLQICLAHKF